MRSISRGAPSTSPCGLSRSLPLLLAFARGALGALVGLLALGVSTRAFHWRRGPLARYGLTALVTLGALASFLRVAVLMRSLVS